MNILFYLKCSFNNPKHTMNYLEFCENVKLKLQEMVEEGTTVRVQKVLKNNNVIRYAAIISEENSMISPSIYLENYYTDFINGQALSCICKDILMFHKKYKCGIDFNIEDYFDYNYIKDKLYLKVINREKNEEFLEDIPYREFCDLALIVYISLDELKNGRGTITVSNKNLEKWNVSKEQVFDMAFLNSYENTPPVLEKMTTFMKDILMERLIDNQDEEVEKQINYIIELIEENNDKSMYILSNSIKINGAFYIVYEDYIREFANRINSDLFIIPSSIHELILIPMDGGVGKAELERMVHDVNIADLSPGEVLSDRVYEFYRDEGFKN